ncbi:Uncharacterized protein APZ42_022360 [Daphnia magna]|uniref:Uncharacterized protein n=1 Tax=Daphnia magna TaxID=35525 RepID=A0A164VF31_9CRUS|nr:Uncharacterized protein APZ42_022360 [Daphnia magna]
MLSVPSHSRQKSFNIVKQSQSTKLIQSNQVIDFSNRFVQRIFLFAFVPIIVIAEFQLARLSRDSQIGGGSPQWVERSKRYTSKHEAGSTDMEPEMRKEMS